MRTFTILLLLTSAATLSAAEPEATLRSAVEKGLHRIEQGAANYIKNRQCFSCHHQHTSLVVLSTARRRGFRVEAEAVRQQIDFTLDYWKPRLAQLRKGQGSGGGNTMVAHTLHALEAAGHSADETTSALVEYLLIKQRDDGSWPAVTRVRPPTEGSTLLNHSLALRVLNAYTPSGDDPESKTLRQRIEAVAAKGAAWLRKAAPVDTEDAAAKLVGLTNAGAEKDEVARARKILLDAQQDDGSWTQTRELAGDAYATGTVLVALHLSGLRPDDPAYQRGVKYLLKVQNPDGAWIVKTRARPVQTFFDNGDPGGKSQFLSFVATGRATLALLHALPAADPAD